MKIINKKVSDLIKYELNNKIHNENQINLIANSIKEFWFKNPIIIDKNNIIIAWHWRLEASQKLWLNDIPCIIADDLTDIQIKKYRLLDNKLAELAENNIENIKLELDELQDIELNELFFNEQIDINKTWEWMPEFNQEDKTAYKSIIIHFKWENEYKDFSKLINQNLTDKTKSVWYPKIEIEKYIDKVYE